MNHDVKNTAYEILNALKITDSAMQRLLTLIKEEGNPQLKLRVFVAGGGCAGLQYGFSFDEKVYPDDIVIMKKMLSKVEELVTLVVDPISFQYLSSAEIDYKDDDTGAQFVIRNPTVKTTCRCGAIAEESE